MLFVRRAPCSIVDNDFSIGGECYYEQVVNKTFFPLPIQNRGTFLI